MLTVSRDAMLRRHSGARAQPASPESSHDITV